MLLKTLKETDLPPVACCGLAGFLFAENGVRFAYFSVAEFIQERRNPVAAVCQ